MLGSLWVQLLLPICADSSETLQVHLSCNLQIIFVSLIFKDKNFDINAINDYISPVPCIHNISYNFMSFVFKAQKKANIRSTIKC